jgi:hypothetical protein
MKKVQRTCEMCKEKDYSTKVRKGKLEKRGKLLCDSCAQKLRREYGECEYCGIPDREGDVCRLNHLHLDYLPKTIVYHGDDLFTYENGRQLSKRTIERLANRDELIRYLLEEGFPYEELDKAEIYYADGYFIDEEDREKLLMAIRESLGYKE